MRAFRIFVWMEVGRFSAAVRSSGLLSVLEILGGSLISLWYFSMRLGSLEAGKTTLVGQPAGGKSLWGLQILDFGWEMAAIFSAKMG